MARLESPVLSSESRVPLPDGIAGAVLLSNVLHESDDIRGILAEGRRILAAGGRLAVLEWRKERTEKGPPVEERLPPDQVVETANSVGLGLSETFEPGLYNYGLVFSIQTGG